MTRHPINLPPSLLRNPDLDSWVRINANGTVTLFTGKVEIGQGIRTAIAQIGAEELDIALERVRVETVDTTYSPDEGITAGSNSLESSGEAIRHAAADARLFLLKLAAEELETPLENLEVRDGIVKDSISGRQTDYWSLFGGQTFGIRITGVAQVKSPDSYTIVGQPTRRLDLVGKIKGEISFVHDLELPGMVHGRVVHPPRPGARLQSFDIDRVGAVPGVIQVVRNGDFLGVIAEREEQAVRAMDVLRRVTTWNGGPPLSSQEFLFEGLQTQPAESMLVVDGVPIEGPVPPVDPPGPASKTLIATYYRPYQMHASLGPSAAAAQLVDGQLRVWTHSQGIYRLRSALSQVLKMHETDICVTHMEGPGCYGHNGADDVALDAAILAGAVPGRPVLLQWTREEEHGWEPYGPAMVVKMQASLDDGGEIIDWNHDVWSYSHMGRPSLAQGSSNLMAAWHLAEPLPPTPRRPSRAYHGGAHRNADPLYTFPKRIVKHFVPDSPLRTSSLRGLGAYANVFAIESFMDELALAAGADPMVFRLAHLVDERARAVIQAGAGETGWKPRKWPRKDGRGRGIGFARYKNQKAYAAVFVDLQVDLDSGEIKLERATIAADAGKIVNPDGLKNQLEGGFVQSASWTLMEEVTFNQEGVTSLDWETYPILRFPDVPDVEVVLINRPKKATRGSGEATQGPTAAAIANAVFDATGLRLRRVPFTPDMVKTELQQH